MITIKPYVKIKNIIHIFIAHVILSYIYDDFFLSHIIIRIMKNIFSLSSVHFLTHSLTILTFNIDFDEIIWYNKYIDNIIK